MNLEHAFFGAIKVQLLPEGYARMEVSNEYGKEITREDARNICKFIYESNEGKDVATMIVSPSNTGVNLGFGVSQEFSSNSYLSKIRVAEAFVISSKASRLIVDFYARLNRKRNLKVFKLEDDAKTWIMEEIHKAKRNLNEINSEGLSL